MANWIIDNSHSELKFKVKHLKITTVTGYFQAFSGEVKAEGDDFSNASISIDIIANSLNTNSDQRDAHLKSGDFFDVEKHEKLTFVSSSYNAAEGKITGEFTIKDVTKTVTFDVEFEGIENDPWGNTKAGFSISGKINRTDFGLVWNVGLEAGGLLVSEDVKIEAEIQLLKQA